MNVTTTDRIGAPYTVPQWFATTEHELLLSTLNEATQLAIQSGHSILASCTFSCDWPDPLSVFSACQLLALDDCFFWEHPTEHHALVGAGIAQRIKTCGPNSFTDAASAWRTFLSDAVTMPDLNNPSQAASLYGSGPVFFGGFAFDSLRPRTSLWEGFPDGLLILPSLLCSYSKGQTVLTLNRMMQATDDSEQCAEAMMVMLAQLDMALHSPSPVSTIGEQAIALTVKDIRPASDWMDTVATAVQDIRQGKYEKVVLARSVEVTPKEQTFDVSAILARLRKAFPSAYIFATQHGKQFFVGATPERLVQAQDGQIQTMALAGSAQRGVTEAEDEHIGNELLHSEKNKIEHTIVVAKMREALLEHCSEVHVSPEPHLLKLKNVQHLETPISGRLLAGRCILDVMANLHPTPAVGGFPRPVALEAIRSIEQLDRGWYAGPLGWIGAEGHGEFAVALRSGLIEDNKAILFAGCGIVADSDPGAEYVESCLKLQAMLRGLGTYEDS